MPLRAFPKALAACSLTVAFLTVVTAAFLVRSPLRRVRDYRLGTDYQASPATSLIHEPRENRIYLGTHGDGVHSLDARTGYFRHFTQQSTAGRLLANDVTQLRRDDEGRLYFLCEDQGSRGRCRLDPADGQWRTLLGIQRFDALTADPPPNLTSVLCSQQQLWLATDRAGIGVYNPLTHVWDAIHQAAGGNLLDNAVRDLLADPTGRIWIATAGGLNRVEAGRWQRWTDVPPLVSRDVRRLTWAHDKLWYVTGGGGLGAVGGEQQWQTVAGESAWSDCSDADVSGVVEDPRHEQLWFLGRKNQTLGLYDRRTRAWTEFSPPDEGPAIQAVTPAADGAGSGLLAATSRGVYRLDVPTQAWTRAGLDQESLQAIDAGPAGVVAVTQAAKDRPAAVLGRLGTGDWRTLIGSARACPDSSEVRAAVASKDGGTLFVGSSAGISAYSVETHTWTPARKLDLPGKQDPGAVIDLQLAGSALWALTESRSIVSWDPATGKSSVMAGGERFGPNGPKLADIQTVTRDAGGNLWLATSQTLYLYTPLRRGWTQVPEAPEKIKQLAAARDGVWALADARAYFCTPAAALPLRQGPDDLIRLFASPDTPGAAALSSSGRLYQLPNAEECFTVVGDGAEGLDLQAATQVAAVEQFLVVGGRQPCLYDALRRSWRKLQTGPVAQVVAADGQIWLRTERGQVLSCSAPTAEPAPTDLGGTAIQLAAREPELAALLEDGGIQLRKAGGPWTKVKDAAAGPGNDMLASAQLQAAAAGDVLYLAGGPQQRLWQFDWAKPAWQTAQGPGGQPLSGVTQLAVTPQRIWALAGAAEQLFSAPHGEATYRQEAVAQVREIRALEDVVTALDSAGDVWLLQDQASQVVKYSAPGANKNEPLEIADLAELKDGVLVAGQNGAAILSRGLASWSQVGGAVQLSRLYSAGADSVWGVSARGELFRLDAAAGQPAWQPVALGDGQSLTSLTVGAGAQQDQVWACLNDGATLRLRKDGHELWHRPSAAPGGPQDVVGVAREGDRFLVAFRNGKLAHCRPGTWDFVETASPTGTKGIDRLLVLGPAANPVSYWLLAGDGQLYRRAAGQADWQPVATGTQQVFAAGDLLLAITAKGRQLQAFDAEGKASEWWAAPRIPPLKAILAAGELAVQEDRVWLVLSDGQTTAAYDPQRRQWLAQAQGFVEFAPSAGSLLGRTAEGAVAKLALVGDDLQSRQLDWGGKVLRIAGAGAAAQALGWLEGGRLVLADDRVRSTLIGSKLGPAQLWSIAACGQRCFVAAADRQLYVYEAESRDWKPLRQLPTSVTRIPKLLAEGTSLWVEAAEGQTSRLFRFDERNGAWEAQLVCDSLADWEWAGGGVLARVQAARDAEFRYYSSAAQVPSSLRLFSPAGPRDEDLAAARSSARHGWLYTQQGDLWCYPRASRNWTKCPLPIGAKIVFAALDREPPVLLTEGHGLLMGRPGKVAGSWDFAALTPDEVRQTDLDADDKHVAFATSTGVFVGRDIGAEQVAVLRFGSAFPKDCRIAALAADEKELFAANDIREVSAYSLSGRQWRRLPPAPCDVNSLFVLSQRLYTEGRNGELACLEDGRWVSVQSRSQPSWQHQNGDWSVDAAGFVHQGQAAGEPPQKNDPLPAVGVQRVHADGNLVWIEFADGAFCQYDEASRRVASVLSAPGSETQRQGLISTGPHTYFVAGAEGRVAWLAPGQAVPVWLKLPAGLSAGSVAQTAAGLVLSGQDRAVVLKGNQVREVTTAEELESLRRKSQPVAADRHLRSGRWSVTAPAAGEPARLARQTGGKDQVAALDLPSGRWAWDVVKAGLSWSGRILLATRGGVAVCGPDPRAAPAEFFPLAPPPAGALDLMLWGVDGQCAVIAAKDGRRWFLLCGADGQLSELREIPAAASPWNVTRAGEQWTLSLTCDGSPAIAVSLDSRGRLGIDDCAGGLALCGDSLFVAATDAVFQYASEGGALRGVARPGRYFVRSDRQHSRLLICSQSRPLDGSTAREVLASEGRNWTPETEEAFRAALDYGRLKDGARPWRLTLPGADGQAAVSVEYRDSRLVSDTPSAERALTSNGQEWFLGTPLGVTVLDSQGGLKAVYPLAKGAVAFAWAGAAAQPLLYVRTGEGAVCSWNGKTWEPCPTAWETLQNSLDFAGHLRRVEGAGKGFRLSCAVDKLTPELWLDPAAGGFTRDAVRDVLFTGQAVWILAGAELERLPASDGVSGGRWPLGNSPQEPGGLRMTSAGPLAELGGRVFRLSESGPPEAIPPETAGRDSRTALLAGKRWSVARAAERVQVTYQTLQGTPLTVPIETSEGWGWDQLRCAAVGSGHLVLETAAGSYLAAVPQAGVPLSLDGLQPLSFGNAGQRLVLDELWVSSRGGIWARSRGGAGWLSLDAAQRVWQSVGNLPDEVREEYERLCEVPNVTWRRKAQTLELAEKTPTGEFVSVFDPATRRFPCDRASAVLEQDGTLWMLTPAGLRQIDLAGRRLLAANPADEFRQSTGEFLRVGARWLLKVKPPGTKDAKCYERQEAVWQEVAAAQNPWSGRQLFADWGHFRIVRNGDQWEFALRTDPAGDRWQPCRFQPRERRFDFQVVRAAVGTADRLFTETPQGIVTWKRGAAGCEYLSSRPDLAGLGVSPDRRWAVAAGGDHGVVEHRPASGWTPRPDNAVPSGLRSESRRWRVLRPTPSAQTVLLANPDGTRWVELPLHAGGDFEFRRPQQAVLGPGGSAWTLTGGTVIRYQAAAGEPWTPQALFAASELPGSPPPPCQLFLAGGTVHVAGGGKVCAASAQGTWQAADAQVVTSWQQQLCAGGGWTWVKRADGELQITRQVGTQPPLALHWDQAAGRFDLDVFTDAAAWNGSLWLAHRGGVSQLDAGGRHLLAFWPASASAPERRFALARSPALRLLVAASPSGDSARALDPASPDGLARDELPPSDAAAAFGAAYHDAEWHFELGAKPRVTWRGHPSDLRLGYFRHDYFYSFLLSGADLWTPTPAGLIRNRWEDDRLSVTDVLPAPENSLIVQVLAGPPTGAVRAVTDAGGVVDWQPAERKWVAADPSAAPQRVLLDDPLWRWTRSIVVPPGKSWTWRTELQVKLADEAAVEPVLSEGRFAFDDMDVSLIDGDDLWLAGRGGIVRRRAADGTMLRWHRTGVAGTDSRPLRDVVALRRFTTAGDPLPSSAADADRQAARLFALDAGGQAWEFAGGNPGGWQAADKNPWACHGGRWLVRTPFLEAAQAPQGRITLAYRNWTSLLPDAAAQPPQVLCGGRFSTDVVRAVAFLANRGYLATPAGIVEVDADGRYARLWAAAPANSAAASSPWQDLVVNSGADRLYATGPSDQALEFDAAAAAWKARTVDPGFCETVDVRHRDDFWCWSRWNGRLRVQLLKADSQGEEWPLLAEGRFSFDVLRNFCLSGPDLWATTPGGVVQFRREDMQILSVSRTAQDWETDQPVPLRGAEQFTAGAPLACYGAAQHYERRGNRWVQRPTGPAAAAAETGYEDATYRWNLKPWPQGDGSAPGAAGGFLVHCFAPTGELRVNTSILRQVPGSRLRGAVAAGGRLWICLDHGLYVYDPR